MSAIPLKSHSCHKVVVGAMNRTLLGKRKPQEGSVSSLYGRSWPRVWMTDEDSKQRCYPLLFSLSQKLLPSTADRGWSCLGQLSQPWTIQGGNQGVLSLNKLQLPAEMQMCSQWRGFNLWRGRKGKRERSRRSLIFLLVLSWVFPSSRAEGDFSILQRELGSHTWAFFLRGRSIVGQGLMMGQGSSKTILRVLL